MNLKNNIPHREFISEVQSRMLWTASLMLLLGLFTTVEAADPTEDTKTLTAEELVILDSDGNRRIELKVEESGPTLYIRDSQGNIQIDIGIETLEDGREEPRLRVWDGNGNIKVTVLAEPVCDRIALTISDVTDVTTARAKHDRGAVGLVSMRKEHLKF